MLLHFPIEINEEREEYRQRVVESVYRLGTAGNDDPNALGLALRGVSNDPLGMATRDSKPEP